MARSSKKKRSRSRGRRNPRSKPRVRSRSRSRSKALRVGTDCSGIEAPIQALKQLRIPFKHVWSSEIDKHCIESIKANYKPGRLYGDKDGPYPDGDMRNRNHNELPDVDLYVCGFPCQSFSQAGVRGSSRRGLSDPRGNIIYSCLDTIKAKRPRYFILENVKGILSIDKKDKKEKYGEAWKIIWSELEKLKKLGYSIDWKVMNTRDYGIPQNRDRVYIVGTMDDEYSWPVECKMNSINKYVDLKDGDKKLSPSNKIRIRNAKKNIPKGAVFVDLAFISLRPSTQAHKYSPCIAAAGSMCCVPQNRLANVKEHLMLQGFPTTFKQVVSDRQMKKQVGNSMSVNVLKKLISNFRKT